jgi:hypothetical protein
MISSTIRIKAYHPQCPNKGCGGKANAMAILDHGAKKPEVLLFCDTCKQGMALKHTVAIRSQVVDDDEVRLRAYELMARDGL